MENKIDESRMIYVATIIDSHNYGTVLQAIATKDLLERFGHPIFIDYCRDQWKLKTWMGQYLKDPTHSMIANIARMVFGVPARIKMSVVFRRFVKQAFELCDSRPFKTGVGAELLDRSAVYCVGSDQTWNYIYNEGIDPVYYLVNVPEGCKKISLSASFGRNQLTEEEIPETQRLLSRFDAISVREASGVNVLNEIGIKGAIALKDPVILCRASLWTSMSEGHSPINGEEGYVLMYMLNDNEEMVEYARQIADRRGTRVYLVTFNPVKKTPRGVTPVCIPTVEEWLSLFRHSGLVVTDSFHGMSFSTIFNIPMVVFNPPRFSVRLTDALSDYGLMDRNVLGIEDALDRRVDEQKIDWENVNSYLEIERKKAWAYLRSALENA